MIFQNKTIIITGASAGIGKELAITLAKQSANLVLAARNQAAIEETASICIQNGGKAIAVPTDVTNPEDCRKLIETAKDTFGAIDVLVNNAGISMYALFEEVEDLSLFEQLMKVNYLGSVYCTHYALPYLKASQGLIVAISSLTGKMGIPTRSGYSASKHAMQGFFDSLRIELRDTKVDVLVTCPGFVATDMRQRVLGTDGNVISTSLGNESSMAMPVSECVNQIIQAMQARKRELIMTPKGRFGMWLKLIAPNFVDMMSARAVHSQKRS
ncbi:3-oxoacyl-(acyl-carrier-protein) reductase [Crinalium epipsammum PCC 9333]|uniref:3-oxoacyl-(Acyl-carrier-protein) reductase n=1 Tax=Crinalium epipsammum PCC 9333 TaxID=1173022 RepID=K9VZM1_9CYAN|nr:SDR family oxidoreductase [Crinalium epipsammum]AFZ12600.1 3-oxoacyl-(acyl-carrier-protein) reductase [Crinalium epipsammum PCC 9333]